VYGMDVVMITIFHWEWPKYEWAVKFNSASYHRRNFKHKNTYICIFNWLKKNIWKLRETMAPPLSICSSVPSGERMNMLYCFEKSLQTKKKKKELEKKWILIIFLDVLHSLFLGSLYPNYKRQLINHFK
jgi:hypothetical protein